MVHGIPPIRRPSPIPSGPSSWLHQQLSHRHRWHFSPRPHTDWYPNLGQRWPRIQACCHHPRQCPRSRVDHINDHRVLRLAAAHQVRFRRLDQGSRRQVRLLHHCKFGSSDSHETALTDPSPSSTPTASSTAKAPTVSGARTAKP